MKLRAAPINYSNVSVNELGQLEERASLLDDRIVEGYGCIWGKRNMHGEKFVKGCFAKSIQERGPGSNSSYEIKFLNQHNQHDPLGLFEILREDEIGLYFRTKPLDDIESADRVLKQLRSGTLNNFSDGFNFIWDKIEYDETDDSLVVIEARLFEISVVTIPSDLETFAIRSLEDVEELSDDTEEFIKTLPRKSQLEARQLFARHKSLINLEPLEQRKKALENSKPVEKGINYNYLINNLKN